MRHDVMITRSVVAVSTLAILVLLVPTVLAQLDPSAAIAAEPRQHSLGPGESATVSWTVRNGGPIEAEAIVTSTAPAGWTIDLPQADRSFTIASGDQRVIMAVARAPDAALNVTPTDGPWELSVTLTDGLGRTADASSGVTLAYVAPAAVPPAPPSNYVPLYTTLAAVTFSGLLVAGYVWQARRVRVVLEENDLDVSLGAYAIVHVVVHNRSGWNRNVHLRVARLPPKWGAAFSAQYVRVSGHDSERVPMFLRLPFDDAPDMERRLPIQVRPNRFSPWLARAELRLKATEVRVPMLVRATIDGPPNGNGSHAPLATAKAVETV